MAKFEGQSQFIESDIRRGIPFSSRERPNIIFKTKPWNTMPFPKAQVGVVLTGANWPRPESLGLVWKWDQLWHFYLLPHLQQQMSWSLWITTKVLGRPCKCLPWCLSFHHLRTLPVERWVVAEVAHESKDEGESHLCCLLVGQGPRGFGFPCRKSERGWHSHHRTWLCACENPHTSTLSVVENRFSCLLASVWILSWIFTAHLEGVRFPYSPFTKTKKTKHWSSERSLTCPLHLAKFCGLFPLLMLLDLITTILRITNKIQMSSS